MASTHRSGSRRRRRSGGSGRSTKAARPRYDWFEIAPLAILLVVAILLGGSADPINDMAIRILALLVLAIVVVRATTADWRRLRPGSLLALGLVAVAAIELVPLPYDLWRALPGRAPFADLLDALHLGGTARPLSLDPEATRATLAAVLPGLAAFAAALAATGRSRRTWTLIVVAGALLTALIGGFQVAGYRDFYFYQRSNVGQLTGPFANRNHASDMLLIGIALLAGWLVTLERPMRDIRIAIGAVIALLAVSVLLTISRFGIALLGVELVIIVVALAPPRRRLAQGLAVTALLVIAAVAITLYDPRIVHTFDRYAALVRDLRTEFWSSTLYATGQYWPVGSGLGTFAPVYTTIEQLDTMPTAVVNHAHNEYLELTLELGVLGPILIVAYLATLAVAAVRVARAGPDPISRAALLGIVVLLAHSTNEFPLRNASLMTVFGLLNGIVLAASQRKHPVMRAGSVSD